MTVGLTGGIGSGKSTVARLFEILGYPVFSSDIAAKEVYFDNTVKAGVTDLLGPAAYISEKEINKSYISSKIFSDTSLLHKLNAIIHPAVKNRFAEFVKQHAGKTVIQETALLFEAGLDKNVDKIIMVASADELRIKRVMQRDNCSRDEVLKKIKSQLPQEEKIKRAHFIIYNNEEEFLITQVMRVSGQLKS